MSGSYIYEVLLREPREGSKFITPPQNKAEPPSVCHDLQHQETITHTHEQGHTSIYSTQKAGMYGQSQSCTFLA